MTSPCEPWPLDDTCSEIPDGADAALVEHWQAVASEMLWVGSGRRYGLCEQTARPCLRSCDGGAGIWPFRDERGWHNVTCGCGEMCSCTSLSEVVLEGPVDSIVQVLLGEEELMPESYRLEIVNGEYRVLRTDGGTWPSCQDYVAECGEEGSFCISYLRGLPLTDLAIAAVTELTSELVKACDTQCRTCRLPKTVTQVVRRGVTLTFDNSVAWLKQLPLVNSFLTASNPKGLVSSSTVWTPDLPPDRVTVVPSGS